MSIFGKRESFEERKAREMKEFTQKYNLESMSEKDLELVKKVASDLAGNGLMKFGMTLSASAEEVTKVTYLSALVERNWIIINQLSRLNSNIEKIIEDNLNTEES